MTITTVNFSAANGTEVLNVAPWTLLGSGGNTGLQCNGSNQAKLATGSGNIAWHGQDIGSPDHFAECIIYAGADNTVIDKGPLSVRAVDRTDHIYAMYNSGDSRWGIYDIFGRQNSVVESAPNGETYRLEAEGASSIRLYRDNVLILSATTSRNASATYAGLLMDCASDQTLNPCISAYRSGLLSDLTGGGGGSSGPRDIFTGLKAGAFGSSIMRAPMAPAFRAKHHQIILPPGFRRAA